jgi:osmotically-inducible protein OsmY
MSSSNSIYVAAFALFLTGILPGCADLRQSGSNSGAEDTAITADVETRLNEIPALGPPGSVRVETLDHVVYLNGLVDGGLEKRLAEADALQEAGVTKVVNNIAVSHD